MTDKDPLELSDADPQRIQNLNLDALTEEQLKQIPRTERHLNRLRVEDLRPIVRDECGPGTWISHVSKEELVYGAVHGEPPRSAQAEDRGGEHPENGSVEGAWKEEFIAKEYAAPVAEKLVQTLVRVVREVLDNEVLDNEGVLDRIERIESLLGIDSGEKDQKPSKSWIFSPRRPARANKLPVSSERRSRKSRSSFR